jgi:hypothetical protein
MCPSEKEPASMWGSWCFSGFCYQWTLALHKDNVEWVNLLGVEQAPVSLTSKGEIIMTKPNHIERYLYATIRCVLQVKIRPRFWTLWVQAYLPGLVTELLSYIIVSTIYVNVGRRIRTSKKKYPVPFLVASDTQRWAFIILAHGRRSTYLGMRNHL